MIAKRRFRWLDAPELLADLGPILKMSWRLAEGNEAAGKVEEAKVEEAKVVVSANSFPANTSRPRKWLLDGAAPGTRPSAQS
jgi:hypothetical protein